MSLIAGLPLAEFAPVEIILVAVAGVVGIGLGFIARRIIMARKDLQSKQLADAAINEAKSEAEAVRKQAEISAKEEVFKQREKFEAESREAREELRNLERRMEKREDNIDRKSELINKKEKFLETQEARLMGREGEIQKKQSDLDGLIVQQRETLQQVAGMSKDEAQKVLLEQIGRASCRERV